MGIPEVRHLNQILAGNNDPYEIDPPDLKAAHAGATVIVPEPPASLELQAQKLIEASLNASDQLLSEGRGRQAVQELLWLLESVSTAFRGLSLEEGSIQGRYFNKIIAEIRGREKGTSLDQILNWMLALHGYLSSPTGGGIRHGTDVRNGIEFQLNDARLYCNLVRSYITYLVGEYDRLQRDRER